MRILLSHPTGNNNVKAIIKGLDSANMLAEFHTTLAFDPIASWLKILSSKQRSEVLRRSFPLSTNKIKITPKLEFLRLLGQKLNFKQERFSNWPNIDTVYKDLDRKVAQRLKDPSIRSGVDAVYAYEDGALETFSQAKNLGLMCIYELPIAYWETSRKLLMEEADRLPNWACTLGGGITDSKEKLIRKTREMEMADIVVVPSEFVFESLPSSSIPKKKIISPFGSPYLSRSGKIPLGNKSISRPLRILYVGSLSQRKGLADLFSAVNLIRGSNIELVVMGSLLAPLAFYKNELPNFTYEIGRSHDEVLKLMRSCDVFCLPSIVEGRALVMQEAMSQGLPLIITPNTGGADLIMEGQTGFLVPPGTPEKIAEKILWFLNNREELNKMKIKACELAAQYTWEKYSESIIENILDYINPQQFNC